MEDGTLADRLRSLIGDDHGRHQMSIRAFWDTMKTRRPRPRGSSRAMIHRYLRGEGPPPPEDFVRAASAVLGVRPSWLAFGDGEATWERQATKTASDDRGPFTREEKEASDLFMNVMGALESLHVTDLAEEVLRRYYYELLDHRDDVPTTMEGIASLLARRFPLTLDASVIVDGPSADLILFGEAAAAYSVDFLAKAREPHEARLENLRRCSTATQEDAAPKKPRQKRTPKGGRR